MPPRWESPFDPPSPRDTALLAEVLGALRTQLTDPSGEQGDAGRAGATDSPPAGSLADERGEAPSAEVQELIHAALSELHRVAPPLQQVTGVAPVLGSGVVQELLRRRRQASELVTAPPPPTVDERF